MRALRRVAALAILAAVAGCGRSGRETAPASPPPPNVLLISVDTVRADHLGCYGYPRPTSGFVDSLARRGVVFERAFAQSSWTLPSHMSLLTSRYPHSHQVDNDDRSLPEGVATLAGELQAAGYSTTAFVSWLYVAERFGFGRGFDSFVELLPPEELQDSTSHHSIKAREFVDRVLEWAEAGPRQPFFLFLHLFDPHINYEPPLEHARVFDPRVEDTEAGTYPSLRPHIRGLFPDAPGIDAETLARVTALYDGEIRYVDAELSRLFDALEPLGLLDHTLVVLTSDHGEEFDDHGSMEGHQWTLYDEVTHVPLLMVFPGGGPAGQRVPALVQSIDVAPTVLDHVGLSIPEQFEGRSLVPRIRGEPDRDPAFTFSQTRRYNNRWALRTERHKLIYTRDTGTNRFGVPIRGGYELYDLESDPNERNDVYDPDSPVVRELMATLERWMATGKAWQPSPPPDITPEERERLESLGYVGR